MPFGAAGYIDGSTQVPYYGGFSAPGAAVSGGAMSGGGVFYRHVCRSDVQTVPSGRGGETDVTVTRCYYVVAD